MVKSVVSMTVKQYIVTTTLHGFKYLYSSYYVDRLGWMLCFCASACCAGVLCAVLWQRFLEMPELLMLWDKINKEPINEKIPTVYVCPNTESIAERFLNKISTNKNETHRIPKILDQIVNGQTAPKSQLELLDRLLAANNVTLPDALMQYSSRCSTYVNRCRYQSMMVPCEQLFRKEHTIYGICCVMNSKKLIDLPQSVIAQTRTTQTLDFVLNCNHGTTNDGCQFYTSYEQEENLDADLLLPGYFYRAQLWFRSTPEKQGEHLVDTSCVSSNTYTKTFCMLRCAEEWCGCSDPLLSTDLSEDSLPTCSVTQMVCIRASEYKRNITCNCLPTCKRISTLKTWESGLMNAANDYTVVDPFYAEINVTSAIVLSLRVNEAHSRIFHLNPTESWLTLLSSLGGVFNMFLGVGLFSALEFLFFLFVKLPKAIKRSSEIQTTDTDPRYIPHGHTTDAGHLHFGHSTDTRHIRFGHTTDSRPIQFGHNPDAKQIPFVHPTDSGLIQFGHTTAARHTYFGPTVDAKTCTFECY